VEVEADDGEDESEKSFKVIINPVNDRPTLDVFFPTYGESVVENISVSGSADDVEDGLVKVEFLVEGEPVWRPALGTESWNFPLNTALYPNGELSILIRSYDGELYSENITHMITVNNPINAIPGITIISPAPGASISPGNLTIQGSATDSDGEITKVKIRLGEFGDWVIVNEDFPGWSQWSYEIDVSSMEGKEVTVYAKALDGHNSSELASVTFTVASPEADVEGQGGGGSGKGSSGSDDMTWLLVLILVIVIVTVLIVLLWVKKKKDDEKRREEEEEAARLRAEEEDRQAALRAASLTSQLSIAQPAQAPAPSPYAPPPPPVPAPSATIPPPPPTPQLPPPSYGMDQGYGMGAAAGVTPEQQQLGGWSAGPGTGGVGEVQLLPPAPAAVAPPPPPPPAAPGGTVLMEVGCYNCGGMVPVTSAERPLTITCPACGTQGEI
jgi:hypothetical protein